MLVPIHRAGWPLIALFLVVSDALGYAAKIIKDHMLLFIHFDEEPMEEAGEELDEEAEKLRELLSRSVEELELSVRSGNCLRRANIKTAETRHCHSQRSEESREISRHPSCAPLRMT